MTQKLSCFDIPVAGNIIACVIRAITSPRTLEYVYVFFINRQTTTLFIRILMGTVDPLSWPGC